MFGYQTIAIIIINACELWFVNSSEPIQILGSANERLNKCSNFRTKMYWPMELIWKNQKHYSALQFSAYMLFAIAYLITASYECAITIALTALFTQYIQNDQTKPQRNEWMECGKEYYAARSSMHEFLTYFQISHTYSVHTLHFRSLSLFRRAVSVFVRGRAREQAQNRLPFSSLKIS